MKPGSRRWAGIAGLSAIVVAMLVGGIGALNVAGAAPSNLPTFTFSPSVGVAPLWVRFTGPEVPGYSVGYAWDFGEGLTTLGPREVLHRYAYATADKAYTVRLTVTMTAPGDPYTYNAVQTRYDCVRAVRPASTVATAFWCNWNDNTIRLCSSVGLSMGQSTVIANPPDVNGPTGLYISEAPGDYLAEAWVTWANAGDNTIRSMRIGWSPTSSVVIADGYTSHVEDPRGIQIVGGELYWANYGSDEIMRTTILTTGPGLPTLLVEGGTPPLVVNKPTGLHVVSVSGGKFIYWANSGNSTIRRCFIQDPPHQVLPVPTVVICDQAHGVKTPGALRVMGPYLYWTNGDNTIRRCSIASETAFPAQSQIVANTNVATPTGLIVTNNGGISWANFYENTIWNCVLSTSGTCIAPTMAANLTSSGVNGPGFMRFTLWNPPSP